jgi:hypothetical protein
MNLRYEILKACAANPGAPMVEICDGIKHDQQKTTWSVRDCAKAGLLSMRRDDVTGQPGYTLTAEGKQRLAEGPGTKQGSNMKKADSDSEGRETDVKAQSAEIPPQITPRIPPPQYDPDAVAFKKTGDGSMRQIGKVRELALGYEGGVGAFITFGAAYSIDLDAMAEQAFDSIPPAVRQDAARAFDWAERNKRTYGLAQRTYIVCDAFKRLWRAAHPEVSSWWKELEDTARRAIAQPGVTLACRRVKFRRDGAWLRVALPSGRALCYPSPQILEDKVTYMGTNQYSRKWQRLKTYGGKLAENITQAASRDVLASSMPPIEAAGYAIVLSVHDELITEAPDSPEFSADHLASLMATTPKWADGLPLAAAGFEAYRYKKD